MYTSSGEISGDDYAAVRSKYVPLLRSMVNRYVLLASSIGLDPDSEDLMQEAEVALINAMRSYKEGSVTFGLYAKVCIRNRLVSCLRKLRRETARSAATARDETLSQCIHMQDNGDGSGWNEWSETICDLGIPEDEWPVSRVIEHENCRELLELIRTRLSPYEKLILICYANGKTYRETAEIVGRDEKSVDNALARIRRKLKTI